MSEGDSPPGLINSMQECVKEGIQFYDLELGEQRQEPSTQIWGGGGRPAQGQAGARPALPSYTATLPCQCRGRHRVSGKSSFSCTGIYP